MRQTDKEYAFALYELALEENMVEEILSDLLTVKESVETEGAFTELLSSPAIPLSERLSLIDEAFGEYLCVYALSFLKVLCEAGRIEILLSCIEEYRLIAQSLSGKAAVVITSSVPLSDEQKKALVEKLEKKEKKKIEATFCLDNSLVGGLTVEIDGRVYDGSVKSRLRDVKEVMMR